MEETKKKNMAHVHQSNQDILVTFLRKATSFDDLNLFHQEMQAALKRISTTKKELHFDVSDLQIPSLKLCFKFGKIMNSIRPQFQAKISKTYIHGATKKMESIFKFVFTIYKPSTEVVFT